MAEKRKILVCVTGLSPQVVTETLYALAVQHDWIPESIRLITTAEGAHRAKLSLLTKEPGWFKRLLTDYHLPDIRFNDEDIRVLKNDQGIELSDIRTPVDNEIAANLIIEQLRQLTADPDTELHVSIAGGRKTMGFYLGYALTLFGRAQDRLSHVLVSDPFESCWDFFYPTPYSRVIQTKDKNLADARDGKVTLAEIPFVSLRHGMTDNILQGSVSFVDAVEAVKRALAPSELVIDLWNRQIQAAGQLIRLEPTTLALLSVFAKRRLNGDPPLPAPNKEAPDMEWAQRFIDEYDLIKGDWPDSEATRRSLEKGMDGSYFSSCKSKLHKRMKNALGPAAAKDYLINDGGVRPRRYSLTLDPTSIHFRKLTPPDESVDK
jgi:CRISPR-associated protein (TIGR02584 family)